MDMDETIKRGGNDVVKIWEVLDFCDPALVDDFVSVIYTMLNLGVRYGLLLLWLLLSDL